MIKISANDPFKAACQSPEGEALRALIEAHLNEMVSASHHGKPALSVVIPFVPLYVAARLKTDDQLMRAFGHMASLEMQDRGLKPYSSSKSYYWPSIRIESDLAIFKA